MQERPATVRVGPPTVTGDANRVRLSARISTPGGTRELWLEADAESPIRVTGSSEPFAVLALPAASRLGIPLEVSGRVSPQFASGLREIVRVRRCWWPSPRPDPELIFEKIEDAPEEERGRGAGCSFSGGVDSFFTLMRNRPGAEPLPGYAVTHLVQLEGFDYDLEQLFPGLSEALRRVYSPLATRLGLGFIRVRTNFKQVRGAAGTGGWESWVAAELAAPALALAPMFRHHYLGSGGGLHHSAHYGSSAVIDHLFSSDGVQIIHDSADLYRHEKLEALAGWDEARKLLRVCRSTTWRNVDDASGTVVNCGRCEKCVRTLIALQVIGKAGAFQTFARPLTLGAALFSGLEPNTGGMFYARENLWLARERRRRSVAAVLFVRLLVSRLKRVARSVKVRLTRRAAR